jgi:dihydroxy-acid dehydratase
MAERTGKPLERRSALVTEGIRAAPARAMLRAVGLTEDDFTRQQVGIASTWNQLTPCNLPLRDLARHAAIGVKSAGGVALEFGTISVSDVISMGHLGMQGSLVSREVIADSVELVVHAERLDGLVTLAGCDKSLPGMLMAAVRTNVPTVFCYGGSILPGLLGGARVDIKDVFEAVGARAAGLIDDDRLRDLERAACPSAGACAGMYTANTMACAAEAMGMALPNSACTPAVDPSRSALAQRSGEAVMNLLNSGTTPRHIVTRQSLENAAAVVMAVGGSTNAVLHLMAIAVEAGVDYSLADIADLSRRVPHLVDTKPNGAFFMSDLDAVGGVPAIMALLREADLIHGDALTVTGLTVDENLAHAAPPLPDGQVIRTMDNPVHADGGIAVLFGRLAPLGCVLKKAGTDIRRLDGIARVFDGEQAALEYALDQRLCAGDMLVVRYEGPVGGPGMPEMLALTSVVKASPFADEIGLITDGRFSGATRGFCIGHVAPEAALGGPLALVHDGDPITIDVTTGVLDIGVSDSELERRRREWSPLARERIHGVLGKYARNVRGADVGAVTE